MRAAARRDGKRTWIKHPIDPFNSPVPRPASGSTSTATASASWSPASATAPTAATTRASSTPSASTTSSGPASSPKQVIDYGPPGEASGCGIHFSVADLDGNGRLDIVAPGKDGLYLFRNLGNK